MRILILLSLFSLCSLFATATEACAHRGDQKAAPENTLAAIRLAVEKGAAQIEFDIYQTVDKQLVVIHDGTVDRTTNGKGAVNKFRFEDIRALDAGSWFAPKFAGEKVPTLEEVLRLVPHTILCNVHLKNSPGVAEATAKVIARMERLDHMLSGVQ